MSPEVVGFVPDLFQRRLLETEARQVILKSSRQWGKSSVTALKTLLAATGGAERVVVVMSPSARQGLVAAYVIYAVVLTVATIYGRYHYAVDAVAGIAMAGLGFGLVVRSLAARR